MSHRIHPDQVISEDKFWNQRFQWDSDQSMLVPCQPSREALSMTHISPCCFVKMQDKELYIAVKFLAQFIHDPELSNDCLISSIKSLKS